MVASATTSKAKGLSNAAVVRRGGCGGVSRSAKGHRAGGRPQAAKKLVLSVVSDGASDRGAQSSNEDKPNCVVRKAKRVFPESPDES